MDDLKKIVVFIVMVFLLLFSCRSKETETLDVSERTENLMLNTSKYAFSMLE